VLQSRNQRRSAARRPSGGTEAWLAIRSPGSSRPTESAQASFDSTLLLSVISARAWPSASCTRTIGLLHPDLLGRGTGTSAIRILLRHAFDSLHLHRVDLRVLSFNVRALRCYEKCGFVREGIGRESALVDGAWVDDVMMSILEHEYRALAPTWFATEAS
jgi:GNAT superfamily N-acetyltransferase